MVADDVRICLEVMLSLKQPSKVRFWSLKTEFWTSKLKSQHLVIHLDQGPHLKCAPSHKSMNTSITIKSYSLRNVVVQNQNLNIWFFYFFHPPGKFWKGKAWIGSSRRGFCSWKIDISWILRHAYFQKVCISWFLTFFSKMAPQGKPLCSRDAQRNSV